MKKVAIVAIMLLILIPVLPRLIPKTLTMDRFEPGFKAAGFAVTDVQEASSAGLGAVEQLTMNVNGASVEIYRFDDEGKIAIQLGYQKTDVGTALVESMHLAEAMGAARPKNKPSLAVRRGMFMMVVTSDDQGLNTWIGKVFSSL